MLENKPSPDLAAVVARLGGRLYEGGRAARVPGPGHSRRDDSLSLRITQEGRVLWFSFAGDPADAVKAHLGLSCAVPDHLAQRGLARRRAQQQSAERADADRKRQFCAQVWSESLPIAGSPAAAYLRGRRITGGLPLCLRYHPRAPLSYEAHMRRPALLAAVVDRDGQGQGLHMTALRPDGSGKASDLRNPRRMFAAIAGGAVHLSPLAPGGLLAVAEGIETALAFRDLTGTPTWAALSTAGLAGFRVPLGLSRLVIAADGDEAGLRAARQLAERARRLVEVEIRPAPAGLDWNDLADEVSQ